MSSILPAICMKDLLQLIEIICVNTRNIRIGCQHVFSVKYSDIKMLRLCLHLFMTL